MRNTAHLKRMGLTKHFLGDSRNFLGVLDEGNSRSAHGWVYDCEKPAAAVGVEVLIDGSIVACVTADRYRSDLALLLPGGGRHGFQIDMSNIAAQPSSTVRSATVRIAGESIEIGSFQLAANRKPTHTPSIALPRGLHDQLNHLFDHVTAVHDSLVAQLGQAGRHRSQPGFELLRAALRDKSPTTDGDVSGDAAIALFEARLEIALARTHFER